MNELINQRRKCDYIVDAFMSIDYGAVIFHKEISGLIQEEVGTHKYYSIVGQANRILTECGRPIKSEIGQGYKLIPPDEISVVAIREYRKGGRAISKGKRLLDYAPVDLMTDEARHIYNEVSDKAKTVHAGISGAVVELKLLARPHPLLACRK